MMQEAGVRVLTETMVTSVIKEEQTLKGVVIENKSGRQAILAGSVVDCTGDADVAVQAGVPYVDQTQECIVSMVHGIANVDLERVAEYARERGLIHALVRADKGKEKNAIIRMAIDLGKMEEKKKLEEKGYSVAYPDSLDGPHKRQKFSVGYSGRVWMIAYHGNEINYINYNDICKVDATNAEDMTIAYAKLTRACFDFTEFLKENVPGFEEAYLNRIPEHLGVRRSRAVCCEYELTREDVTTAARFEDEVGLYGYNDLSPKATVNDGEWFGLPYRAIVPSKVDQLLVAGRLISSDYVAHMSTRNTVSCMLQGHAAGTAAALAAMEHVRVRDLDVKKLREVLRKQGAFL